MDEFQISDFDGVCRLFPLPGVVQFPHSVLPLHVFEPRYRQMTEDALASDGLITIVQLRPPEEFIAPGIRAIESFGCLGRIIRHQRLDDGRFRILLHGLARVHLLNELPSTKLYRLAQAEVVTDREAGSGSPSPEHLASLFRQFIQKTSGSIDPEMDKLLASPLTLGILTDIMGHSLPLSSAQKQHLLSEGDCGNRASTLLGWLSNDLGLPLDQVGSAKIFPPPFSMN